MDSPVCTGASGVDLQRSKAAHPCQQCGNDHVKCDGKDPCGRCKHKGRQCTPRTMTSSACPAFEMRPQRYKTPAHDGSPSLENNIPSAMTQEGLRINIFDGRFSFPSRSQAAKLQDWLTSFEINVLPYHPVLTPTTFKSLIPQIMAQVHGATTAEPGGRLEACIMLRLGAAAYEPFCQYPDWTSELLTDASMLSLNTVADLRLYMLAILLIIYCATSGDGSHYRYMSTAVRGLQYMMENNILDLRDPDNVVLAWGEIVPRSLLVGIRPIMQHLPPALPPDGHLHPPARRMAEILVEICRASPVSENTYTQTLTDLNRLTDSVGPMDVEATPRFKAQLYALKVFVAQASKQAFSCTWSNNGPLANASLYELGALRSFLQTVRNVGDHDRRLFLEREYEYVMQAAYAHAHRVIDFEAWTDYSAGLRQFLREKPMPDAKFEGVLRLHSRFARVRNEVSRGQEGTFLVLPPA